MSIWTKIGQLFSGLGGGLVTSLADTVDRFVTTPAEREALKAAITEAAYEHELKLRAKVIEEMQLELADRDSARQREVAMALAKGKDGFMVVAGAVALGVFVLMVIAIVLDHKLGLYLEGSSAFHHIMGVVEGVAVTIVAYYFGTSKSSKDKTDLLDKHNIQ
jgi:hypothetical protein